MASNDHIEVHDLEDAKTAKTEDKEVDQHLPDEEPTDVKNCNIFISYQWKSQSKVRKLYNELVNHESLDTFMDIFKIKAGFVK